MNVSDLGNQNLRVDNCIISYPTLFEPRRAGKPGQETGEPRFSCQLVFPALTETEQAIINATYQAAIAATWPHGDAPQFPPDKNCFVASSKSQLELAAKFPGRMVVSANSTHDRPPEVFNPDGSELTKEHSSKVFGGCIVNAVFRVRGYTKGSNGVSAALNGIMLVDNMNVEHLDGGVSTASAFGITQPSFPPATSPAPNQPGPAVPAQQQVAPGAPAPAAGPLPGVPTLPDFLS